MTTTAMSVQDSLWLTMDRPNNLMVVDGAMVLRGRPDSAELRKVFDSTLAKFPVLKRRPVRAGLGWAWEDSPDFNLEDHLQEITYDQPISMVEVQQFLSEQRSIPLSKDRPLWCAHLLSPVVMADGTLGSALVERFHHSIADGVRLTQVLLGMCESDEAAVSAVVSHSSASRSEEHDDGVLDIAKHAAEEVTDALTSGLNDLVSGAANTLRHPRTAVVQAPGNAASMIAAGWHGLEGGIGLVRHPDRLLDALEALGVENYRGTNDLSSVTKLALASSEETVWTGEPGLVKAVAWSEPISLSDVKAIGKQSGATVNDVLLAAIAGGLRRYLAERGDEVEEVIWMVPVNLKPFEENLPPDLGNYFALVFVPMPLSSTAPADRLSEMHHRMERIKNSDEAVLTFGLQRMVSTSPSQIAYFLTNFFANKAVGVLTNVPGPRSQITLAGVPVHQVVGFAPCSGNQPMTATIFSYNGGVTVGFATDAGLVPDPDRLSQYVLADIEQMKAQGGAS